MLMFLISIFHYTWFWQTSETLHA